MAQVVCSARVKLDPETASEGGVEAILSEVVSHAKYDDLDEAEAAAEALATERGMTGGITGDNCWYFGPADAQGHADAVWVDDDGEGDSEGDDAADVARAMGWQVPG